MGDICIADDMLRYVGQTVTIFTESGGLSGSGFTGVLACVTPSFVKLITCIGAPPCCPIGSACTMGNSYGYGNSFGYGYGYYGGCGNSCNSCYSNSCGNSYGGGNLYGFGGYGNDGGYSASNILGSVTEIPVCKIVSFTHNSIG